MREKAEGSENYPYLGGMVKTDSPDVHVCDKEDKQCSVFCIEAQYPCMALSPSLLFPFPSLLTIHD